MHLQIGPNREMIADAPQSLAHRGFDIISLGSEGEAQWFLCHIT